MKIYNEQGQLMTSPPDLEKGWLEAKRRLIHRHEAVPEQAEKSHLEVMEGTESMGGLRHRVIDRPFRPAVPAWEEWETVQVYHPHPIEPLPQLGPSEFERDVPDNTKRIPLLSLPTGGVVTSKVLIAPQNGYVWAAAANNATAGWLRSWFIIRRKDFSEGEEIDVRMLGDSSGTIWDALTTGLYKVKKGDQINVPALSGTNYAHIYFIPERS